MATLYSDVYDFFLNKVEDYSFIDTSIYATEADLEQELKKYLRSAVLRFTQSRSDLTRDDSSNQFVQNLTELEQEILASMMVIMYINPKIVSTENMEQFMSDPEYQRYSQGKHLQEMIKLKRELQLDVNHLISTYSYSNGLTGLD